MEVRNIKKSIDKNKNMKNMKELNQEEAAEIEGGGIIDTINRGIAAYKALKEFFSGRPQV